MDETAPAEIKDSQFVEPAICVSNPIGDDGVDSEDVGRCDEDDESCSQPTD